jgi:hypothetical protein
MFCIPEQEQLFTTPSKTKKMLQIILAILLALSNPASNNTVPANNSVQVSSADYTGGETGHIPPRPPKP